MTTIQTKDLTGAALDWAVACAIGLNPFMTDQGMVIPLIDGKSIERPTAGLMIIKCDQLTLRSFGWQFNPSTDWGIAGPIIEREHIFLEPPTCTNEDWSACIGEHVGDGATATQAAMRAYVASKFGDTIEIPDELITN